MQHNQTPYSVSYLWPAPAKVPDPRHPHEAPQYPAEYIGRVNTVFSGLVDQRAKAAFYALHRPIVGHHEELEGLLYNAPPHWDDKTLTATEVDGTLIEKFAPPS